MGESSSGDPGGDDHGSTDPDPPTPIPPGTGKYPCPLTLYKLDGIAEEASERRPYPRYYITEISQRSFPYEKSQYFGLVEWNDWDGRLQNKEDEFVKSRGHGYQDLNATYFASEDAILDKRYKVVLGTVSSVFEQYTNMIYLPTLDAYVRSDQLLSARGEYLVLVGFRATGTASDLANWDTYSDKNCPIEVLLNVDRA